MPTPRRCATWGTGGEFAVTPDEYCERIAAAKASVGIPIIGSLNASTRGGWSEFARRIEQAGADALELNLYDVPTNLVMPGSAIEERFFGMFHNVKTEVKHPIAVKLSPFFSNFANVAKTFDDLGAQGLVLFNRFYQPDIELETREEAPNVMLSAPISMRIPMRWIAILHGRIGVDLAATGGIHGGIDALKMVMADATVTMLGSVLLQHGIGHLQVIEREMREWMEEHEVGSLDEIRGAMSVQNRQNPTAFEQGQYLAALTGWQ